MKKKFNTETVHRFGFVWNISPERKTFLFCIRETGRKCKKLHSRKKKINFMQKTCTWYAKHHHFKTSFEEAIVSISVLNGFSLFFILFWFLLSFGEGSKRLIRIDGMAWNAFDWSLKTIWNKLIESRSQWCRKLYKKLLSFWLVPLQRA